MKKIFFATAVAFICLLLYVKGVEFLNIKPSLWVVGALSVLSGIFIILLFFVEFKKSDKEK